MVQIPESSSEHASHSKLSVFRSNAPHPGTESGNPVQALYRSLPSACHGASITNDFVSQTCPRKNYCDLEAVVEAKTRPNFVFDLLNGENYV